MRDGQLDARVCQPRRLRGLTRIILAVLGLVLVGYAYFGRGFAYIGIPPFYVDSAVMALSGFYLILRPKWILTTRDPSVLLLFLFMGWGMVRTFPYISLYGIDALRDSAIWSYGIFAILIGYMTWRMSLEFRITHWYTRWMGWFPLWAPVALLVYWLYGEALPRFPWGPGGGVPVLNPKVGDVAVHLAGSLAYWLLIQPYWRDRGMQMRIFWMGWLASFALVAFMGRAAFLTIALVALILVFNVNPVRWVRVVALVASFVTVMGLADVEVDLGLERTVSVDQLVTNLASIFGEVEGFSGEGSKRWRLMWWNDIIAYTFLGPYFWTGKGFGINLANEDGFQVSADGSLRSPHNGHLTILARSGVPGFILWTFFLITVLVRLWKSYGRRRSRGEGFQAGLRLWVFSYLLAAIINGAFDVYLEGPQGGIWFWSIVGFGLGLLVKERSVLRNESAYRPHPLPAARR